MKMNLLVFLVLTLVFLALFTGCMKDKETCNYDGICQDNETDNCVDCENVLGRGVDVPAEVQDIDKSTGP
ncbi:hypothetical protein K9L97_05040 [Candidatus Woesearchaeota archaeon]|nr:hypothetical protein [Candidatus Woesearchaeota archaeon]